VAAAVLVGGLSGFGGAALWAAVDDDADAPSSLSARVLDPAPVEVPDGTVQAVAEKVLPAVVQIEVSGPQGSGSGSGIVLSEDGDILTNEHVVSLLSGGGGQVAVSFSDGSRARAALVGTDPLTDLAVIRAEDVSDLTPAALGSSGNLSVGQGVVAIGSPYGLDATVTTGIVSALNRPVQVGRDQAGNTTAYAAIQTDAAINPGNSGGPLVDLAGRVVGINASIRTTGTGGYGGSGQGGSIGLGFAIPIDAALPIVEQILAGETPTHARLGIVVADVRIDDTGATGAQVQEAADGSAADRAGLEPGDVITSLGGTQITSSESLIATIRNHRPGDEVELTYVRDGDSRTTTLELGSDAD